MSSVADPFPQLLPTSLLGKDSRTNAWLGFTSLSPNPLQPSHTGANAANQAKQ